MRRLHSTPTAESVSSGASDPERRSDRALPARGTRRIECVQRVLRPHGDIMGSRVLSCHHVTTGLVLLAELRKFGAGQPTVYNIMAACPMPSIRVQEWLEIGRVAIGSSIVV